MSKSYDKEEIYITVEGGIIQDIDLPENSNCRIIVRDYDVECVEADLLSIDEDGEQCIESIWEN